MLANLLTRLQDQETNQAFSYSVVVVDNDHEESARSVTESLIARSKVKIEYDVEPRQNIALARNKAVRKAEGDYLALIDDDEYPIDQWLSLLYGTIARYGAQGVVGTVIPHFALEPPKWVVRGRLCERERFSTGTVLASPSHATTANVMLSRLLIDGNEPPFDPTFGLTGGEDTDFFRRMMRAGARFVWCNEAIVHDVIPAERLQMSYFLKRALLRGVVNARGVSVVSISAGKSTLALVCYIVSLPLLLIVGYHHFVKVLIKLCDHLGKVLAILGLKVVRRRTF